MASISARSGAGLGEFLHPAGPALTGAGVRYAADSGDQRIQVFRWHLP